MVSFRQIKARDSRGFILPIFLITTVLIAIIITTVMSTVVQDYRLATREYSKVNAQLAADAGLDEGLSRLNTVAGWTGSGGEVTLLDTASLRTTYQTTLVNGATDDQKVLAVVARSYSPSTAAVPSLERRYEIDVQAVTSGTSGSSVVTGVGGLVLNNNAKITGGDVVVNGTITLGNNAQIGLSSTPEANAVNVRVAHTDCPNPADATYPRVCASGENGEPISIGNNGWIYADVRATNQTTNSRMSNPGLIPNQTVAPLTLPDYDRAGQIAAVTTSVPPTSSLVSCGSNQTKTWPANLNITGNISLGNNCTVNLSGDVWISGDLSLGNNARINIPSSAGTTPPVVMIDGSTGMTFGNNAQVVPNSSGTGGYFIAYWSSATCSPSCTDVTGVDLKNSQNQIRINLQNNGSASGSILYARWARTRVENNGAIGAVAGQSIELGNNAVINFTASVPGSDNLTVTWVKRGYMRVYD